MKQEFKNREYFENLISTIEEENKGIFEDIENFTNEGIDYDRTTINYELFSGNMILISSLYSIETEASIIVRKIAETIDYFINSIDSDEDFSDGGSIDYAEVLEISSLAVLTDSGNNLSKLSNFIEDINYPDYLVKFMLKNPIRDQNKKLLWSKYESFQILKEITQSSKSEAEILMKDYLENKYYTKTNLGEMHNSHKKENGFTFSGYWSWEAGAITKLMGLDDSSFKDNPYYPYDMVRRNDN